MHNWARYLTAWAGTKVKQAFVPWLGELIVCVRVKSSQPRIYVLFELRQKVRRLYVRVVFREHISSCASLPDSKFKYFFESLTEMRKRIKVFDDIRNSNGQLTTEIQFIARAAFPYMINEPYLKGGTLIYLFLLAYTIPFELWVCGREMLGRINLSGVASNHYIVFRERELTKWLDEMDAFEDRLKSLEGDMR